MTSSVAAITNPISLCAYVVSGVFAVLAKKWNAQSNKPGDKRLFYLAATVSVVALAGGLFLAWNQSAKSAMSPGTGTLIQNSSGDQSPNINSSGSGAVTVQSGTAPAPPPPEKKR